MSKIFDLGNIFLNNFMKEILSLEKTDHVLEIGFGPGGLINKMAEITTRGVVEGIDFSPVMLKQASKVNKHHISAGRVRLHKGESAILPFDTESINKLCSINTIYFWNEPDTYFSEMYRVIKPGGMIVIGFRDDKQISNINLSEDVFNFYSQDEVVKLLSVAGFSSAHIKEKEGSPFVSYCAVATKP